MANVRAAQDYYPFGMQMPGIILTGSEDYRYGFNGIEQDDKVKGDGLPVEVPNTTADSVTLSSSVAARVFHSIGHFLFDTEKQSSSEVNKYENKARAVMKKEKKPGKFKRDPLRGNYTFYNRNGGYYRTIIFVPNGLNIEKTVNEFIFKDIRAGIPHVIF